MVDTLRLKAKLTELGYTQEEVAIKMSINPATFNRKINNTEGTTLTVKEVSEMADILNILKVDLTRYFFV